MDYRKDICKFLAVIFLLVFVSGCAPEDAETDKRVLALEGEYKDCILGLKSVDANLNPRTKKTECELIDKKRIAIERSGNYEFFHSLLYALLLVILGGVIGGTMNGIADKSLSDKEEPGEGKFGKFGSTHMPVIGYSKNIMVGVGAALVGITFLGSFVHLKYESLVLSLIGVNGNTIHEFIETSISVLGLAVISGFLGVRLVHKVADSLLSDRIDQVEENSKSSSREVMQAVDDKTAQIEDHSKVRDALMEGWYSIIAANRVLDQNPKDSDAILLVEEGIEKLVSALELEPENPKIHTWLAYGYKRLGQYEPALASIEKAIKIQVNPKRLYNKICYMSLLKSPASEIIEVLRELENLLECCMDHDKGMDVRIAAGLLSDDKDFEYLRKSDEFLTYMKESKLLG